MDEDNVREAAIRNFKVVSLTMFHFILSSRD